MQCGQGKSYKDVYLAKAQSPLRKIMISLRPLRLCESNFFVMVIDYYANVEGEYMLYVGAKKLSGAIFHASLRRRRGIWTCRIIHSHAEVEYDAQSCE